MAWERGYDRVWLRGVCDEISKRIGNHCTAIWPLGYFEAARESWVMGSGAPKSLLDLEK